jgi:hypothetical protein
VGTHFSAKHRNIPSHTMKSGCIQAVNPCPSMCGSKKYATSQNNKNQTTKTNKNQRWNWNIPYLITVHHHAAIAGPFQLKPDISASRWQLTAAKKCRLLDYYAYYALSVSLFLWLVCCVGPNLPWSMSKQCDEIVLSCAIISVHQHLFFTVLYFRSCTKMVSIMSCVVNR